jgi:hypothetical protein
MHTSSRRLLRVLLTVIILVGLAAVPAVAQDSKSTVLAKELATLLDQAKLDAIAARDPASPDSYVAALYFPGAQLLVVSARYSVPVLLNEQLAKKNYKDIYIDLNSASIAGTKTFIVDMLADGLKGRRAEGQAAYDSIESPKRRLAFDGDWKAQKITEEEYLKAFTEADDAYARMLTALIAQAKKG